LSAKTLTWLSQGRFQRTKVPNSTGAAPALDDGPVEFKSLGERKLAGHERRR
jgi:hypothetical protein